MKMTASCMKSKARRCCAASFMPGGSEAVRLPANDPRSAGDTFRARHRTQRGGGDFDARSYSLNMENMLITLRVTSSLLRPGACATSFTMARRSTPSGCRRCARVWTMEATETNTSALIPSKAVSSKGSTLMASARSLLSAVFEMRSARYAAVMPSSLFQLVVERGVFRAPRGGNRRQFLLRRRARTDRHAVGRFSRRIPAPISSAVNR